MGKVVVALELIPASKKPIQQLYFLRQYWETKSSFCQATTYPAKISLIRSGLLLMFKVEWSRYIYWAHGKSRRGAWIKVLSPMGRGSGVVSLVQGPRPNGPGAPSRTILQDQVPRPNDPWTNPRTIAPP